MTREEFIAVVDEVGPELPGPDTRVWIRDKPTMFSSRQQVWEDKTTEWSGVPMAVVRAVVPIWKWLLVFGRTDVPGLAYAPDIWSVLVFFESYEDAADALLALTQPLENPVQLKARLLR